VQQRRSRQAKRLRVDKTGNIYVSDSYNHRVQKYQNAQIIIKGK
jgi:hypothetical protein